MEDSEQSSAGHKLGQLVGDWFQDYFAKPLLDEVSNELGLFLDHRNCVRGSDARGGKILWRDEEQNAVDYDFVMELAGRNDAIGVPVAFFECFWRRGARHSKDKARDDSGKLVPMRSTYPTARFLGIVASGEFTRPARELVVSRNISLFYVPKAKIIETFSKFGLEMDYPDKSREEIKAKIASQFERGLDEGTKLEASSLLRGILGRTAVSSYISSVKAALSSPPLEFRIVGHLVSSALVFEHVDDVSEFLKSDTPDFDFENPSRRFGYQVSYSDGTEFEREMESLEQLRELHGQMAMLADHMKQVMRKS